jgi:hypothetical protein
MEERRLLCIGSAELKPICEIDSCNLRGYNSEIIRMNTRQLRGSLVISRYNIWHSMAFITAYCQWLYSRRVYIVHGN